MAVSTITVEVSGSTSLLDPLAGGSTTRTKLRNFARLLKGLALGALPGSGSVRPLVRYGNSVASGTLTLSSASGTVGGTINGQAVTVTASGGDAATAAAIAAAINASAHASIAGIVTATASGAVVTVYAAAAGAIGNAITIAASGTGVTASGARLTGGTTTTVRL